MRSVSRLALLVGAATLASASDVHQLKQDSFKPFVEENNLVLAEFYAPWCGHCKALAPEYETAATTLKEKNIALVKVDCTEEADLCQSFGVEGYPTLKVFRGPENITPYNGQRKADSIVSYMVKQGLPPVSILESKDKFDEFKGSDKVVVVGFFAADDKTSNETFTSFAEVNRDNYLFGATNDVAVAKAEGVTAPAVILYKTFDEGKAVHDGKFEKEALESFAKVASVPLVGEVGPETYSGYMAAGIPLAYIFAETKKERDDLAAQLKPVAQKHKGKINFAVIDAEAFGQHGANLNLEVGKWPAFAIQDTAKNQKFPFDQTKTITEKDIGAFVEEFVSGKVSPSIKSEAIPEKNDGPVVTVVAHNYEDVVLKGDKDVLLEFYAPWCGHCKALAPKYEELGALYQNDPALAKLVTIAKVDATLNDVPDEIQGFPTIKLFAAGKKDSPIEYSGSRTVEDLVKFIKENGSHKAAAKFVEVVEDAAEAAESVAEKVAESATDAAKGATDAAADAAASATDAAADAAKGATEVVKDATDSVKSGASEATEAVKGATDSVKSAAEPSETHDEL